MLYRYKCHDCRNYVNLLLKTDMCMCPLCDGEMSLCEEQNISAKPDISNSVIIQRGWMQNGKELLIISATSNVNTVHVYERLWSDKEWQPMDSEILIRTYPKYTNLKGKVF